MLRFSCFMHARIWRGEMPACGTGRKGTGEALCRMLYSPLDFWVFCTGKQVSMCHFHQFCKVTKTNVEIMQPFMYNVTITVF